MAVIAGILSAPASAIAEPSQPSGAAAEEAAREAASEQAPRLGDLTDHSVAPEVGSMADLSDPLPDDELGLALEEAEATGEPVELASETTESVISWAMPDGTVKLESTAGPVRTQVDGNWIDVDTTLELTADGVQPAAVPGSTTFSAGGTAPMAVLGDGDGSSVRLQWPAELPAPTLEGDTATYSDVLPNVDLVLTATRTGFTQHLIVNSVPDAATLEALTMLEFPLAAEGATVTEGADDQLAVVDDGGEVVGSAAAPVMWDARTDPATDEPVAIEEIGLDLAPATVPGTDATLVLTPAADFLTDPATVYPVTIDPTQTLGAIGDTFVQIGIGSGQGGSTELRSGTYNGGAVIARSYLRFNVAPLKNRVVQSANLALWENHSYSCSARWVDIRESGDFDPNTLVWNNQPWINWNAIVGNANVALGYSSACPANWVNFNLTGHAQYFADSRNNYPNIMAFAVTAGSESDTYSWKKFNSGNAASGVPVLTFTYDGNCDQYAGQRVCGAIRDKWNSVGGVGSYLGLPTTGDTAINGGYFTHFQGGSIYYSANTGAHIIRGALRDKWQSLGWENSYLGYPSTDEVCGQAGGGCYQHFYNNATMFWTAPIGAKVVYGDIRNRYAALGWHNSFLGYPTSDEFNAQGGRGSDFQQGSIYWSSAAGAHNVQGAIHYKWNQLGRESSNLGLPIADEVCSSGGCRSDFAGGSIVWSQATEAHTIRGWIRDKWVQLGAGGSILGYPTTDEAAVTGGQFNDFTGGSIYSSVDSGAHLVRGVFRDYWTAAGATAGHFGFPISDQYSTDYGERENFQGGQILFTAATGQMRDCTITGSSGSDQIIGTQQSDLICALGGNDTVSGGDGDDLILGDDGDDVVDGGEGSDFLKGGAGADLLDGQAGADRLEGEGGGDSLLGQADDDLLAGGDGVDLLEGGEGADSLYGGPGDDELLGGHGDDLIEGEDGNDEVVGDGGMDSLVGGEGADALGGGAGADVISGGDGNDVLAGDDEADQLSGGLGQDTLTGGTGEDELDGGPTGDTVDGGAGPDACTSSSNTDLASCESVQSIAGADQIASFVTDAAPIREETTPPVPVGSTFVVDAVETNIVVPLDATAPLMLEDSPSDPAAPITSPLSVTLPNAASLSDAVLASDGTLVYEDSSGLVDVGVQAIDGSMRVATVISSPAAPSRYAYALSLPAGSVITQGLDGVVTISSQGGDVLGMLTPAWAKDAQGRDVPTHYEVAGNTITQVVDHSDSTLVYPVTADPVFGKYVHYRYNFIWNGVRYPTGFCQSCVNGKAKISVGLTSFGNTLYRWGGAGGRETVRQVGWRELRSWWPGTTGYATIKQQYDCHVDFAWLPGANTGGAWDMELWRPAKWWYMWTIWLHRCNWTS